MRTGLSCIVLSFGFVVFACSSGNDGSSGSSSSSSSSGSSSQALTSFTSDVMPILQKNCSTSGSICHGASSVTGDAGGNVPRPYFGAMFGMPDTMTVTTIHDGIVNTPSVELPTMPYITPKDTSKSFLFYKISGTQGSLTCPTMLASPPCGLHMPFGGQLLGDTDRGTIQAWIEEGAPNN